MNIELYDHIKVNPTTLLIQQLRKIKEEIRELEIALTKKDFANMFEETFDVQQATNTFQKLLCSHFQKPYIYIQFENKLHLQKMINRYEK